MYSFCSLHEIRDNEKNGNRIRRKKIFISSADQGFTYIFDWSFGIARPLYPGRLAPRPSIGSRLFWRGPSCGITAVFARKHSTGSFPPVHVVSLNSEHSPQTGTWVGSSEGKWFFQSVASIFPDSRKRWICRAVYFIRGIWAVPGFIT
jgi:hypothetical protein